MKSLSFAVALVGFLALAEPLTKFDLANALLGVAALICAGTTYRSAGISSFLKIFIAIFSVETVVFSGAVLIGRAGLWPAAYQDYLPPDSLPLTVAIFSIVVYAVAHWRPVVQIMRIADRYFSADDPSPAQIWPFPAFDATLRSLAMPLVVSLVLINQAQVGIAVRLSFFQRDWFNAIQARDAAAFWYQLLVVFTPLAFVFVSSAVVEFFMQSMLVIRWRRW